MVFYRKPNWFWDFSWTPVSGCWPAPNSPGCANCWPTKWNNSHTHASETVYTAAFTKEANRGRRKWTGILTAYRDGDEMWDRPLTHPGVVNPALGHGKPNLISVVYQGDLFVEGLVKGLAVKRPKKDIDGVCATIAASKHIGLLLTKYTPQMASYLAGLDPRTARVWKQKLWLGFSAENQECFNRRWADIRPFAEAGWFVYVVIAPMLTPVTLPPDFLALGKRTWVVCYGECEQITPEECRPMEADWARAVRDQCRAAEIPLFIRAMHSGEYVPPDLQIREFPTWP
jgi:protein gp37